MPRYSAPPALPSNLRALLVAGLAAAAVFVALTAAVELQGQPLLGFDQALSSMVAGTVGAQPAAAGLIRTITDIGAPAVWWTVHIITVVALSVARRFRLALFVVVAAGGGGLMTTAVKNLVGRPRPDWPDPVGWADGFAFPSGHTSGTALGISVLLIVLLPLLTGRWRVVGMLIGVMIIMAVGASRVLLGVHWPSDVLGGLLLAAAWVPLSLCLIRLGKHLPSQSPSTR